MSYTDAKTTLSKRPQFTAPEILLQLDPCEQMFENPRCQKYVLTGQGTEHKEVCQRVTVPICTGKSDQKKGKSGFHPAYKILQAFC